MDETTSCPLNDGNHRYFIFKTYEAYQPVSEQGLLFTKQEYAVLGCNCGSVIKREVIAQ